MSDALLVLLALAGVCALLVLRPCVVRVEVHTPEADWNQDPGFRDQSLRPNMLEQWVPFA